MCVAWLFITEPMFTKERKEEKNMPLVLEELNVGEIRLLQKTLRCTMLRDDTFVVVHNRVIGGLARA